MDVRVGARAWASVGMLCCGTGPRPTTHPRVQTHANRPLKNYPASSGAMTLKLFGTPIAAGLSDSAAMVSRLSSYHIVTWHAAWASMCRDSVSSMALPVTFSVLGAASSLEQRKARRASSVSGVPSLTEAYDCRLCILKPWGGTVSGGWRHQEADRIYGSSFAGRQVWTMESDRGHCTVTTYVRWGAGAFRAASIGRQADLLPGVAGPDFPNGPPLAEIPLQRIPWGSRRIDKPVFAPPPSVPLLSPP